MKINRKTNTNAVDGHDQGRPRRTCIGVFYICMESDMDLSASGSVRTRSSNIARNSITGRSTLWRLSAVVHGVNGTVEGKPESGSVECHLLEHAVHFAILGIVRGVHHAVLAPPLLFFF